jgi:hypothetical protein
MKKLLLLSLTMFFAGALKAQSSSDNNTVLRSGTIETVSADGESGVLVDDATSERKYYLTRDGEFHRDAKGYYLTRDGEFHYLTRDGEFHWGPGTKVSFIEITTPSGRQVYVVNIESVSSN